MQLSDDKRTKLGDEIHEQAHQLMDAIGCWREAACLLLDGYPEGWPEEAKDEEAFYRIVLAERDSLRESFDGFMAKLEEANALVGREA
jgi:hypothetical protein